MGGGEERGEERRGEIREKIEEEGEEVRKRRRRERREKGVAGREGEMKQEKINSTFYSSTPRFFQTAYPCPLPSIFGLPGNGCHVPVLITPPSNHLTTHLDDR